MRVKICGITNPKDAIAAAEAGADAIGLNFVGGPRRIEPALAREILRVLPPMVTPVALLRWNPSGPASCLRELFDDFRVSHLQVYGQAGVDGTVAGQGQKAGEAAAPSGEVLACREDALEWMPDDPGWTALASAGFRLMPVVAVRDAGFARSLAGWGAVSPERRPAAVVLDAYDPLREGGTGRSFRWEWVVQAQAGGRSVWPPILLAGGLHPGNVSEAVGVVRPYGVDVSSGVEIDGSPGRKDFVKMISFVRNARAASDSL